MRDVQRPANGVVVVLPQAAEAFLVRIAPVGNQFFHREAAGGLRTLWQNSHAACHLERRQLGDHLPVQHNLAALHRHHARQGFEQGGFAAAIRPDDRGDFAARNLHTLRRDDSGMLIAHGNIYAGQNGIHRLFHSVPPL